jgi:hypothetical protein
MRAHPDATRSDVSQQRVEPGALFAGVERIYPNEHTVDREETGADLLFRFLGIEHRLGRKSDGV